MFRFGGGEGGDCSPLPTVSTTVTAPPSIHDRIHHWDNAIRKQFSAEILQKVYALESAMFYTDEGFWLIYTVNLVALIYEVIKQVLGNIKRFMKNYVDFQE